MESAIQSVASCYGILHAGFLLPRCGTVDSTQQGKFPDPFDCEQATYLGLFATQANEAVYVSMWYAMAPAVSFGIFAAGALYWLISFWALPKFGGYRLVPVRGELSDGTVVQLFEKHPKAE